MFLSLADLLNTPSEVEFDAGAGDGIKTYRVGKLTKGQEARFARWLEKRVRDDAARALAEMPAAQSEQYASGARRDIAAGLYGWGTPACVHALQTREGQIYAIYLALSDNNPEIDLEAAERLYEHKQKETLDLLAAKVEEGDPKVTKALRDMLGVFTQGNTTGAPSSSSQTRRTAGNRKTLKKPRKRK